jgi:hypothetical protein
VGAEFIAHFEESTLSGLKKDGIGVQSWPSSALTQVDRPFSLFGEEADGFRLLALRQLGRRQAHIHLGVMLDDPYFYAASVSTLKPNSATPHAHSIHDNIVRLKHHHFIGLPRCLELLDPAHKLPKPRRFNRTVGRTGGG